MSASESEVGEDEVEPHRLEVGFSPRIQAIKLILILCIPGLVAFAVIKTELSQIDAATWRFLGAVVLVTLAWAVAQAKRIRNRTPQVIIDRDGIFARHWHAGIVPWENIELIAHSSTVRRGIIQQLARSRRGPYILFKFREPLPFVTESPPPLSWLQRLRASFETQEPVIAEHGLDTRVTIMLNTIQNHLAAWRARQEDVLPPS